MHPGFGPLKGNYQLDGSFPASLAPASLSAVLRQLNLEGEVVGHRIAARPIALQLGDPAQVSLLLTTAVHKPNVIAIHQRLVHLPIYGIRTPVQSARDVAQRVIEVFKLSNSAHLASNVLRDRNRYTT